MSADDMIERGELEEVTPNVESGRVAREEAARHIESARIIADRDPNGAYQLAYDGARKAVMAHMRERGVRVSQGEALRTHVHTARYAQEALDFDLGRRLDAMRRRRNTSEYGSAFFSTAEVEDAIAVASQLLDLSLKG